MLRAILNKSWRQHPTRHQLYGHLPPITKTIQVRWTRHVGHCWRSRDELISDVLLWTPTHSRAKAGRPIRTYIQQLCEDTGCSPEDLPEAMNDREKWREWVRDILTTSTTSWWWWYLYKQDLVLNNLPYAIKPNQPINTTGQSGPGSNGNKKVFLSVRVFRLLSSSSLLFPQRFGQYVLRLLQVFVELGNLHGTTSFIESKVVASSDSASHNRVQVLSIPVLLLACSQDWTCNHQMIVSLEAYEPTPITVTLCVLTTNREVLHIPQIYWTGALLLDLI